LQLAPVSAVIRSKAGCCPVSKASQKICNRLH
jgi:hypothetical protein